MRPIRRTALSAAAIVLAVTLTACSSGDDADASKTEGADSQETAQSSGSDEADSTGEPGSAEAAGLDRDNLPDPIASQDIPAAVEGDDKATMTVELFPLKRQGETVVAQFAFTVNSDSSEEDNLFGYLGKGSWSPFLVDSQNLRKHEVLKQSINAAKTDVVGPKFASGQTHYAFAVFAAPPPDVQEVEVSVVDGMNLVTGAKIS